VNKLEWKEKWRGLLNRYLGGTPRLGIFIHKYINNIDKCLEVACGSSNDSIYLARKGFAVTASDFEDNVIKTLQQKIKVDNLVYIIADAFNLPFFENSYDLVFHNGFFVLFQDNLNICKLLLEQERISKKYIIVVTHNKENTIYFNRFKELAKSESLYDIRFFTPAELKNIIKKSGIKYKSIKLLKFGGISDVFYKTKLKKIIPNIFYPFRNSIVPKLYQLQSWQKTVRIACLIELKK
jgi:SAM-dependent methyltransferase